MDKRSVLDRRCYVVGIFWLLLIALASVALAAPAVLPKPSSLAYSVDTTGMITAEDAAKIAEMGRGLDAATGAQVVVVTIPSLDGASIEEYATTLFRNWGIGNAEQNNGVLLLIAKEDRKFRIEVGYGLEGAITDGYAGSVLDGMKADFKSENYSEAIVTAYAKLTQKAYEEYGAEVPENVKDVAEEPFWGVLLGAAIFFGLIALLVYAVWGTLKGILACPVVGASLPGLGWQCGRGIVGRRRERALSLRWFGQFWRLLWRRPQRRRWCLGWLVSAGRNVCSTPIGASGRRMNI